MSRNEGFLGLVRYSEFVQLHGSEYAWRLPLGGVDELPQDGVIRRIATDVRKQFGAGRNFSWREAGMHELSNQVTIVIELYPCCQVRCIVPAVGKCNHFFRLIAVTGGKHRPVGHELRGDV
ncbi:hypothetical protein [Sinorhizobium medicae]